LIERKSITLLVNEIFNQWREKNEKWRKLHFWR
jgi:hypothetical protein